MFTSDLALLQLFQVNCLLEMYFSFKFCAFHFMISAIYFKNFVPLHLFKDFVKLHFHFFLNFVPFDFSFHNYCFSSHQYQCCLNHLHLFDYLSFYLYFLNLLNYYQKFVNDSHFKNFKSNKYLNFDELGNLDFILYLCCFCHYFIDLNFHNYC
jgi:hypothetical protein